jgi:hypothetical protein
VVDANIEIPLVAGLPGRLVFALGRRAAAGEDNREKKEQLGHQNLLGMPEALQE